MKFNMYSPNVHCDRKMDMIGYKICAKNEVDELRPKRKEHLSFMPPPADTIIKMKFKKKAYHLKLFLPVLYYLGCFFPLGCFKCPDLTIQTIVLNFSGHKILTFVT